MTGNGRPPERLETGSRSDPGLFQKTNGLILWRLVFVSFILLLTVFLQQKETSPLSSISFPKLYFWIALQYFFSLLYLVILFRSRSVRRLAIFQVLMDGFFVTAAVYLTGGIESFFSYLYFLVILGACTLFYRRGGLLTALYVSLWYALLLLLQGRGLIPFYPGTTFKVSPYSFHYYLYQLGLNGAGFFFVGYLASLFSEESRKQSSQIESQKRDLNDLEERNKVIFENLDFGIITLNQKGLVLSINPAGEKVLGLSSPEIIQQPVGKIAAELERPLEKNGASEPERFEILYRNPRGQSLRLGFSMIRVNDFRSQGVGGILSFKDITQIKAMEERFRQVDRLALMGQMVAGFAHEVRNPLASISGSIQVLTDEIKGSESGERLLKIVSREVNKLDTLLADFLTFARPAQTPVASFDLIELIHDTITLIKKNKKFPASIQWEVAVEPPLHLKIAKGEFSQVLWNLLINALQAVPDDGLIRIGARKQDTDPYRGWVELTVRDNGPGIPPNELAKVFEPFFTTKEKGTGLGLSVVQKIVSDHGGLIRVESHPGKGAEFILLFPGIEENRSGPVSDKGRGSAGLTG